MLSYEPPQTPGSARSRSRFSKALPAPPPPLDTSALDLLPSLPSAYSHPASKQLPSIPPVPSPVSTLSVPASLARKPVRKPVTISKTTSPTATLPPVPSILQLQQQPQSAPQSPLPPPPPPMSIPRRPVCPPKNPEPAGPNMQQPPAPAEMHPQSQSQTAEPLQWRASPPVYQKPEPSATYEQQPSPTDSIGSLLSAYSRSSAGESLMARSVDGDGSQRDSAATESTDPAPRVQHPQQLHGARDARKEAFTPSLPSTTVMESTHSDDRDSWKRTVITGAQYGQMPRDVSQTVMPPKDKSLPPPPLALKDDIAIAPPTPAKDSAYPSRASIDEDDVTGSVLASIMGSSPPRDQLWRRRSVKSDRSIQLPDLKLPFSHGSTAASQPQQAQSQAPALAPITPSPLTPSTASQPSQPPQFSQVPSNTQDSFLPARTTSSAQAQTPVTRKPLPSAPAKKQSFDAMGNEISKFKLETKASSLSFRRDGQQAQQQQQSNKELPPPPPRLPTPEYQTQDVQTPALHQVVSPISPVPSPLPPKDDAAVAAAPERAPISRKPVSREPSLRSAKSLPQMRKEPVTIDEAPPPIDPAIKTRDFAASPMAAPQPSPRPPRSSSNQPRPRRPSVPWDHRPSPGHGPGPGPGPGPAWRSSSRPPSRPASRSSQMSGLGIGSGPIFIPREPRINFEFREMRMEDLPAPDPRAMRFPKTVETPCAPGTIFKALPVKPHMLACHAGHRELRPSPQGHYPLACQACGLEDREERWACLACYVRVCAGCRRDLGRNGRDLGKLMEEVALRPRRTSGMTGEAVAA